MKPNDDLPYGPGNTDYEYDGAVQREIDDKHEINSIRQEQANEQLTLQFTTFAPNAFNHGRNWARRVITYGGADYLTGFVNGILRALFENDNREGKKQ